jgi:putative salt-induced outer membrane protein
LVRKFLPFLAILGLSTFCSADRITLKNGDRLTGTILKADGKTLVLHTDAAGDVAIKFSEVQEIKTDEPMHVSLKGGQTAVGPVSTSDDKIAVARSSGGAVEVAKGDVTALAPEDVYEKSLHPGLRHGWNGGINVGFSLARGNSETENLALAFNAEHPTLHDKITLYASSIDTKNDLATPTTVANLTQGGLRYDRDLRPHVFIFGAGDFMSNALQNLDLRQVYSGGFGYHAIKSETTLLDFLGGVNYTHETYSDGPPIPGTGAFTSYGRTNRFVALTLGEELNKKLGETTMLAQNLGFFPNLQQTGEYRFTFNIGTVTKIGKRFGWQNQFGDIYVSNPPTGTKKNDVIFTTGLNFSFANAAMQ